MIQLRLILLSFLVLAVLPVAAQQDTRVKARIILIGDAGKMDEGQSAVIAHASSQVLTAKTTVFFLGDNIYPSGMALAGSKEEGKTQAILRSQFNPLRAKGATVYFIPGNHDWDHSGKLGLQKVKQQGAFLASQGDSLLKLVPANGCPGPVAIPIAAQLTVIAFDSEWWLSPESEDNAAVDCDCKSKEQVLAKLKALLKEHRGKTILMASHHPFLSDGAHGGHKKLPLFSKLYRRMRLSFPSRQDLAHPLYRDMIRQINNVLSGTPNVMHVSGHDHGLQLLKGDYIQVVSGSGAKTSDIVPGKHSLFADAHQGYVIADLLEDQQLRLTFFVSKFAAINKAFTILIKTNASD